MIRKRAASFIESPHESQGTRRSKLGADALRESVASFQAVCENDDEMDESIASRHDGNVRLAGLGPTAGAAELSGVATEDVEDLRRAIGDRQGGRRSG